jgi:hypothetical protein
VTEADEIPAVFHGPPRARPHREATQRAIRTRAERLAGKARGATSDLDREAMRAAADILVVSPLRVAVARRRRART